MILLSEGSKRASYSYLTQPVSAVQLKNGCCLHEGGKRYLEPLCILYNFIAVQHTTPTPKNPLVPLISSLKLTC